VDKPSPTGKFRIKFDNTLQELYKNDPFRFHEWGGIQMFKGSELVYSRSWDHEDSMEDTIAGMTANIEWVNDNTLRLAGKYKDSQASDTLIITNQTDQSICHLNVSLGKYEQFQILDLVPGQQVLLKINHSPDFLIASGVSDQKNKFLLNVEDVPKLRELDGVSQYELEIKQTDLKTTHEEKR